MKISSAYMPTIVQLIRTKYLFAYNWYNRVTLIMKEAEQTDAISAKGGAQTVSFSPPEEPYEFAWR